MSLFRYVFAPEPKLSNIAFIGYIQPIGSILPISEIQSRWVMEVWSKRPLPSKAAMLEDVQKTREAVAKRYVK